MAHASANRDGSFYRILGEVKNGSGTPLEYVKITATFDAGGNVNGDHFSHACLDVLPPGAESPFEIGKENAPATRCRPRGAGRTGSLRPVSIPPTSQPAPTASATTVWRGRLPTVQA